MPSGNYTNRILPSMRRIFDLDGNYRCERDLHHHLTALFDGLSSLRVGQADTLIKYEYPTTGTYQWSGDFPSSGNIDMYLLPDDADPVFNSPAGGIAVEVNCNYTSITKTKQDLIKLLDPENTISEAVYVVVGTEREMRRCVELGFEDAFAFLTPLRNGCAFPLTRILLVEELGGWRFLYEGCVTEANGEAKISWEQVENRRLVLDEVGYEPTHLLDKDQAKQLLRDRMLREGIPLNSRTACCMFDPIATGDGRQVCHFGKTPLWDHVLELDGDRIAYAVFLDWLDKLTKYGKGRQGRR